MRLASRFLGGIAVAAILFTVGCSSPSADTSQKPPAASEGPGTVEGGTDVTDPDRVSLWVSGYMSANGVLTSLEIELPDESHINLVPADDVSYYVDGVSITPAEALAFYQNREDTVYVALDTWALNDPMDVSEGDVYTIAYFTGG